MLAAIGLNGYVTFRLIGKVNRDELHACQQYAQMYVFLRDHGMSPWPLPDECRLENRGHW